MKKVIESGFILPVIVILGTILNFKSYSYSSNLSWFEVGVSSIYLVIWALNFKFALKNKRYKLILASIIFWIVTFITASMVLYDVVNPDSTLYNSSILLYLNIFLLTPLFGFKFVISQIASNRYIHLILILTISFIFSLLGLKFLISQRKNRI